MGVKDRDGLQELDVAGTGLGDHLAMGCLGVRWGYHLSASGMVCTEGQRFLTSSRGRAGILPQTLAWWPTLWPAPQLLKCLREQSTRTGCRNTMSRRAGARRGAFLPEETPPPSLAGQEPRAHCFCLSRHMSRAS